MEKFNYYPPQVTVLEVDLVSGFASSQARANFSFNGNERYYNDLEEDM